MFKGKEEKEMERKIRIRKSKSVVQSYIMKLEQLQKRVFGQGKEYAKLGEQKMVRSQASKYLALESRVHQAKKLLLLMEEAEIQRELNSMSYRKLDAEEPYKKDNIYNNIGENTHRRPDKQKWYETAPNTYNQVAIPPDHIQSPQRGKGVQ